MSKVVSEDALRRGLGKIPEELGTPLVAQTSGTLRIAALKAP
jgi:hypothetical protein